MKKQETKHRTIIMTVGGIKHVISTDKKLVERLQNEWAKRVFEMDLDTGKLLSYYK